MAVLQEREDGSRAFLQPLTWKLEDDGLAIPREEAFALSDAFGRRNVRSFLQAMMDAAWEIGLRPAQAKDQTDELKAVRYHLEDMRALALKTEGGTHD